MTVGRRNDLTLGVGTEGGGYVVPSVYSVVGGLGFGELGSFEEVAKDGWGAGSGGFQSFGNSLCYDFGLVVAPGETFFPV